MGLCPLVKAIGRREHLTVHGRNFSCIPKQRQTRMGRSMNYELRGDIRYSGVLAKLEIHLDESYKRGEKSCG